MPAPLKIAVRLRDAPLADIGGEHWAIPILRETASVIAYVDTSLDQEILDVAER
jgi:hypothetical protein